MESTFSIMKEAAAVGTDMSVILWLQAGVFWEGLGGNSASLVENLLSEREQLEIAFPQCKAWNAKMREHSSSATAALAEV